MKFSLGISNFLEEISATAAKSLQLCPTLCNPIDGSPPGSLVPGILQARKRSLVFPILFFSSISLHYSLMKAFLSLIDILWNSTFRCLYFLYPTPEARGCGQEEQPHVQGVVAAWVQEGLEELFHVHGQEGQWLGDTPHPR